MLANKELQLGDLECRVANGMSRARRRHGAMEAGKLAEQWGLEAGILGEAAIPIAIMRERDLGEIH